MQKKSKTILTAVVTALFMLSLGYFALLAPTTAWYYQREDESYTFDFGNFSMTESLEEGAQSPANVTLRGTTRFADAGETLFNEMLYTVKVAVDNENGEMAGSINVHVKRGDTELSVEGHDGLKWFVYSPDAANHINTPKDAINAMLRRKNSSWPLNYNTLTYKTTNNGETEWYTDYDPLNGEAEAAYEAYNTKALSALQEYNERGFSVLAGETKDVYIVFWAEYGDLKSDFGVNASAADRTITERTFAAPSNTTPITYSGLTIEITAKPDTGGTQTSSLTISGAAASVELYLLDDGKWKKYTESPASDGTISVSSGSSVTVSDILVGTPYKLKLVGATPYFDNSNTSVRIDETGRELTGTISNAATTVTLLSTPTLVIFNESASSAASVELSTWTSGAWAAYPSSGVTYESRTGAGAWSNVTAGNAGELSVPAGGSVRVTLTADTQYKLKIKTASLLFDDSGRATQIIGKIADGSDTVSIIPNP